VPEEARLGPFLVRAERERVEAYQRRTGAPGEGIPAAFPICWLAQPQIRQAIEQACGDRVPLHEGQMFEYARPLELGRDYRLSLVLREELHPPRLALEAKVETADGKPCLRMETLLRLVAPAMELSA
jgi:hypothetical protein